MAPASTSISSGSSKRTSSTSSASSSSASSTSLNSLDDYTTILTQTARPYETSLHARAHDLHANEEAISNQEALLAHQHAALAKQTHAWQGLANSATKSLNEFGDLQNWAECLERDLAVLEETIRISNGGEEDE